MILSFVLCQNFIAFITQNLLCYFCYTSHFLSPGMRLSAPALSWLTTQLLILSRHLLQYVLTNAFAVWAPLPTMLGKGVPVCFYDKINCPI